MNRTKIETVLNPDGTQGYTWNPITGCTNHTAGQCKGGGFPCYAYILAHGRLEAKYNTIVKDGESVITNGDPFYPRYWPERVEQLQREYGTGKGKRRGVFACDMSDLFGLHVPSTWTDAAIGAMEECEYWRFYLLTKQPQRLQEFSPFPSNCWVGVTVTRQQFLKPALEALAGVEAGKRYIYFEPLLEHIIVAGHQLRAARVDWVIVGAQTQPTKRPELLWVEDIIAPASIAGSKVWLKKTLLPLFPASNGQLAKEIPHD